MNNFRQSGWSSSITPVVKNLIIINVIMLLAQVAIPGLSAKLGHRIDMEEVFGLHHWQYAHFSITQLITYQFLHAGIMHLFMNMFGLFMFGPMLEMRLSSKRFLFYYLLTGVGAGIIQLLVWTFTVPTELANPELITIGASGAIFGILLGFGWLFPEMQLLIFFMFPVKARYVVIGYAFFELFNGVAQTANDNVAHFAHLGGMLFGVLLLLYWKKKHLL